MRRTLGLLAVLGTVSMGTRAADAAVSRPLTIDDRVAAQRAIEQVYWRHRLWPTDNPQPKPSLDAVMPEAAIRAKVEDYLKKSNALETWWRRPITGEQLQAELDRMARGSRDRKVLQELFDALGNDPVLIAETLARPALVDRLARNWYANDDRFHAATRREAERALAGCRDVSCMKTMGGRYGESTLKPELGADAWKRGLQELASRFDGAGQPIPTRRLSALEETPDAFVVQSVLSKSDDEVVTVTASWPKKSFDAWWSVERASRSLDVAPEPAVFTLPTFELVGCTVDTWAPTQLEAPDMRSRHTAVWTGTEMIVWGGTNGGSPYLNTGGRYNPSTDTWLPTSMGANVPSGRVQFTAIWTGTEMIVWGGFVDPTSSNSGGRYNPSTDSWLPTPTGANVPAARYSHSAVWTGTEMIVWGGFTLYNPTDSVNTGGRYNPSTNAWMPTSTGGLVPSSRGWQKAVWTGTEMIVWGGGSSAGNLKTGGRYNPVTDLWASIADSILPDSTSTAIWTGTEMIVWGIDYYKGGRYNPATDSWVPTSTGANVPDVRNQHTAVWTGTEMIIWGGYPFWDVGGRYNPVSDTWLPTAAIGAPHSRQYHTAVWTGSEMIVWGGDQCNGNCAPVSNTGGRYNPATNTWIPTAAEVNVPGARNSHTAVWTGSEMIVWGGTSGNSTQALLNSGGRYDAATDTWSPTSVGANVPSPRHEHTGIWTGTEMIVWGGRGGEYYPTLNDGGRYNLLIDRWTPTSMGSNLPGARFGHTAVWTGREMIVWGGYYSTQFCCLFLMNNGGRYDPVTDLWVPTSTGANVPEARYEHRAVWTGTQMIVWGGSASLGSPAPGINTGGRYTPATDSWTPTSTGIGVPSGRMRPTAVWAGNEMIVWGGVSDSNVWNTGARYVPSTDSWTATSTAANVPSARFDHTATWTGSEMIVWGGRSFNNGVVKTGARYAPSTDNWTATSLGVNVPPERVSHTAVWTGTEMIVWGGFPPASTAGRYCACPSGRLVYRDADGDGYGDTGVAISSCDGSIPAGYVADGLDCNDVNPNAHPSTVETCNGIDDNCNGLVDEGAFAEDSDGDFIHNLCDNCRFVANVSQSDFDHDGQGDACDLNDGLIVEWRNNKTSVTWQAEQGPTSWNVYIGDLAVLKSTGVYTQVVGSNPLASKQCGVVATTAGDPAVPTPGKASFSLITGVTGGVEGLLGSSSSGPRPNTNPCP